MHEDKGYNNSAQDIDPKTSSSGIAKFYDSSTMAVIKHGYINKSLRKMWIWFLFIIGVSIFDVLYNIYWMFVPNFTGWDNFTHNQAVNAWIFLFARSISLLLAFFPIVASFLGRQILLAMLCPWMTNRRRIEEEEDNPYYDEI